MARSEVSTSNFDNACRDNDIHLVRSLVETMTLDPLDKFEPNDSTALDVASYLGHHEIVELSLQKCVSRSIKNKYNNIPSEEPKIDEATQLFTRANTNNRFVGNLNDTMEWIRVGRRVDQEAKVIR
jgi:hypothetical protein